LFAVPVVVAVSLLGACGAHNPPEARSQPLPVVTIVTSRGSIQLELFEDDAPNTVANFVSLVEQKFYDGLTFHRVEADFMIQGGCPQGDGMGGPGYRIDTEASAHKHLRGVISMANAGANTEGSQFFITHRPCPHLDGRHAVFGRVIDGMDVVDAVRRGDAITRIVVNQKRPHPYVPKIHP
jgi:peptidyl-prolyl cis-trans isomerase B (cyclophilin B)